MFHNFKNIYNIYLPSPVNIPMGGYYEVYTSMKERTMSSYPILRKASYTGTVRRTRLNLGPNYCKLNIFAFSFNCKWKLIFS